MKPVIILVSLLLCLGCMHVFPDVAREGHRMLSLTQSPDHLYIRSERALIAMGVVPSFHDAAAHILVATLPGETQPLRIVASPSVIGHTLTIDGPESAIRRYMPAFDAQR